MVDNKCPQCGAALEQGAEFCKYCGAKVNGSVSHTSSSEKSKVAAGLLGIFLGAFGIHKFYLGYSKEAIIMLVICLAGSLIHGLGAAVMAIIGLVEGIIYLTKSDSEFEAVYIRGHKGWF